MKPENQDQIQERLEKESRARISTEAGAELDGVSKLEARLKKTIELTKEKRQRLEEVQLCMTQSIESMKLDEMADVEALSEKRAALAREAAKIKILLIDLEKTVIPEIKKELEKAREAQREKIYGILLKQRDSVNAKVLSLIQNLIEPEITGWKNTAEAIRAEFHLGAIGGLDITFFSPLVAAACQSYGPSLEALGAALALRNRAK